MNTKIQHNWDVTPEEAKQIQLDLQRHVITEDNFGPVTTVAGVDVGYEENNTITRAAIVVLDLASLKPVEQAIARLPTTFPYVPGYLSFREVPAIMAAMAQLSQLPDMLLCDGQGIAHPRRFGIACHLGVLTNLPAIGVAKSRFIGSHDPLPPEKGAWVPLMDKEEIIGAVLRTRTHVNPLYISAGHRISLATAIDMVMQCVTRYRLPETTRLSDRLASRRGEIKA